MNFKLASALVAAAAALVVTGCSVGMQPEGSSVDQIKAKEAAMPPEQQISMIQNSPMPADQKAAKIAELKTKYNIK